MLKEHNPNIKLLVLTPPPICAYRLDDRDRECGRAAERTAEHTALYAAKAKSVAEDVGVPCVDLWNEFLGAAGWNSRMPLLGSTTVPRDDRLGTLLPDGLHFSAEGNKLCFQLVFEKIKQMYPELNPDKMDTVVPMWDSQDILATLRKRLAHFDIDGHKL